MLGASSLSLLQIILAHNFEWCLLQSYLFHWSLPSDPGRHRAIESTGHMPHPHQNQWSIWEPGKKLLSCSPHSKKSHHIPDHSTAPQCPCWPPSCIDQSQKYSYKIVSAVLPKVIKTHTNTLAKLRRLQSQRCLTRSMSSKGSKLSDIIIWSGSTAFMKGWCD